MNILLIAQTEDDTNLKAQLAKQTFQPNSAYIYVDKHPAKTINGRRKRIAENHLVLQMKVRELKPDLVWQVEGDCDLSETALEDLYANYLTLRAKDFGYVSGIQVGRHGLYCLGAWQFDDAGFHSLDYRLKEVQPVDATGFYCLLAPASVWLQGDCDWQDEPYGPDVVFGLSLRAKGYKLYCDMDVTVGHIIKSGIIRPEHTSTCNARFYQEQGKWKYKQTN